MNPLVLYRAVSISKADQKKEEAVRVLFKVTFSRSQASKCHKASQTTLVIITFVDSSNCEGDWRNTRQLGVYMGK